MADSRKYNFNDSFFNDLIFKDPFIKDPFIFDDFLYDQQANPFTNTTTLPSTNTTTPPLDQNLEKLKHTPFTINTPHHQLLHLFNPQINPQIVSSLNIINQPNLIYPQLKPINSKQADDESSHLIKSSKNKSRKRTPEERDVEDINLINELEQKQTLTKTDMRNIRRAKNRRSARNNRKTKKELYENLLAQNLEIANELKKAKSTIHELEVENNSLKNELAFMQSLSDQNQTKHSNLPFSSSTMDSNNLFGANSNLFPPINQTGPILPKISKSGSPTLFSKPNLQTQARNNNTVTKVSTTQLNDNNGIKKIP